MDSFKLEIYLAILEEFKNKPAGAMYICVELERELLVAGATDIKWTDLPEIFPEFFNLYDNDLRGIANTMYNRLNGCWWDRDCAEPRIRILEFIIGNRL